MSNTGPTGVSGPIGDTGYPSNAMDSQEQSFVIACTAISNRINAWACEKGWNSDDPLSKIGIAVDSVEAVHYDIAKIGLMVTELAEAIEGRRHGDPLSDKIGDLGYTQVEEELADTVIRIMHHTAQRKLNTWSALIAKLTYNNSRPYKHGKQA